MSTRLETNPRVLILVFFVLVSLFSIFINGIEVTLDNGTGTNTVADAVIDITAATIAGITAINDDGALRLTSTGVDIILAEGGGTALGDLGFAPGTTTGWNIATSDNTNRVQAAKIDVDLFKNSTLYNNISNKLFLERKYKIFQKAIETLYKGT